MILNPYFGLACAKCPKRQGQMCVAEPQRPVDIVERINAGVCPDQRFNDPREAATPAAGFKCTDCGQ